MLCLFVVFHKLRLPLAHLWPRYRIYVSTYNAPALLHLAQKSGQWLAVAAWTVQRSGTSNSVNFDISGSPSNSTFFGKSDWTVYARTMLER